MLWINATTTMVPSLPRHIICIYIFSSLTSLFFGLFFRLFFLKLADSLKSAFAMLNHWVIFFSKQTVKIHAVVNQGLEAKTKKWYRFHLAQYFYLPPQSKKVSTKKLGKNPFRKPIGDKYKSSYFIFWVKFPRFMITAATPTRAKHIPYL